MKLIHNLKIAVMVVFISTTHNVIYCAMQTQNQSSWLPWNWGKKTITTPVPVTEQKITLTQKQLEALEKKIAQEAVKKTREKQRERRAQHAYNIIEKRKHFTKNNTPIIAYSSDDSESETSKSSDNDNDQIHSTSSVTTTSHSNSSDNTSNKEVQVSVRDLANKLEKELEQVETPVGTAIKKNNPQQQNTRTSTQQPTNSSETLNTLYHVGASLKKYCDLYARIAVNATRDPRFIDSTKAGIITGGAILTFTSLGLTTAFLGSCLAIASTLAIPKK